MTWLRGHQSPTYGVDMTAFQKDPKVSALAQVVEEALAAIGYPVPCVCGETCTANYRVHALGEVPRALLEHLCEVIDRQLPLWFCLHLTSWSTHPRAFFNVTLDPLFAVAGSYSNALPAPEGEACGNCGTRAVVARRCSFCGARA